MQRPRMPRSFLAASGATDSRCRRPSSHAGSHASLSESPGQGPSRAAPCWMHDNEGTGTLGRSGDAFPELGKQRKPRRKQQPPSAVGSESDISLSLTADPAERMHAVARKRRQKEEADAFPDFGLPSSGQGASGAAQRARPGATCGGAPKTGEQRRAALKKGESSSDGSGSDSYSYSYSSSDGSSDDSDSDSDNDGDSDSEGTSDEDEETKAGGWPSWLVTPWRANFTRVAKQDEPTRAGTGKVQGRYREGTGKQDEPTRAERDRHKAPRKAATAQHMEIAAVSAALQEEEGEAGKEGEEGDEGDEDDEGEESEEGEEGEEAAAASEKQEAEEAEEDEQESESESNSASTSEPASASESASESASLTSTKSASSDAEIYNEIEVERRGSQARAARRKGKAQGETNPKVRRKGAARPRSSPTPRCSAAACSVSTCCALGGCLIFWPF